MDKHLVPDFIKAQSLIGLRNLMLKKSMEKGHFYKFFNVEQVKIRGKLYFVAWYYRDYKEVLLDGE